MHTVYHVTYNLFFNSINIFNVYYVYFKFTFPLSKKIGVCVYTHKKHETYKC